MKFRRTLTLAALPALAALTACVPQMPGAPTNGPAPVVEQVRAEPGNAIQNIQVGTSPQGRPVMAQQYGTGPNVVLVVGGIHANEQAPTVVTNAMAQFPWDGSTTVWVIPTLNVDGNGGRLANGVDLNRDGRAKHALETLILDNFINVYQPKVVVHVHSPSNYTGHWGGGVAATIAQTTAQRTGMGYRGQMGRCGPGPDCLWHGQWNRQAILFEVPAINGSDCGTCWDNRHQTNEYDVNWRAWVLAEQINLYL